MIQKHPSKQEVEFWQTVFDTYCKINSKKPKTQKQIKKWLKSEPADSAVYKMWGNGIALPCAVDVMQGIVDLVNSENQ